MKNYYIIDDTEVKTKYVCKICNKSYTQQSNVCRHISLIHQNLIDSENKVKEKDNEEDLFLYNSKPISNHLLQLICWKNTHSISMKAIVDPIFKNLFQFSIPSEKTLTAIQNSIATQILEKKFKKCQNKCFSITIDAGTVIGCKWLAIGALIPIASQVQYNMLDVFTCTESLTADYLVQILQNLKEKLKNYDSEIIGVCSDNASNFKKVFGLEYSDILKMLRIACSAHTIQLAVHDFIEKFQFDNIVKILKFLSSQINLMTKKQKQEKQLQSFPNIQPQRWNWVFKGLDYILKNAEAVEDFLTNNQIPFPYFDILQLKLILEPIDVFTTDVEGDSITLSKVYILYKKMINELKKLQEDNSKACGLIRIIKKRFKKTGSLDIIKIVYYSSYKGIEYFQKKYVEPLKSANSVEKSNIIEKKQAKIEKIQNIIYNISKFWPEEEKNYTISIASLFTEMLVSFIVPEEQTQIYPKFIELKNLFTSGGFRLFTFIQKLNTLPATEAQSERIFATMRDLLSDNMTNISCQTLRNMIIISYYAREANK